ncbi:low temperature requirement protein A [Micromonospora sp. NPDC050397]|uniref:low temperature requirement protein A n=1 Tax=Micromonospora sp. NPDC050397 TaxID=3364279 RepID=UPI00384F36CB
MNPTFKQFGSRYGVTVRSQQRDKGVTWEELFVDLALAFSLTEFTRILREDHGWSGLGRVLILFAMVYWAWTGIILYANQRDVINPLDRVGLFTLGFSAMLLALTISGAWGARGPLFAAAFLTMRVVLGVLVLRNLPIRRALFHGPFGAGFLSGPLLLAGAVVEGTPRIVLWAAAAIVDLASPWVTRRTLATIQLHTAHYTHRYGLLIILVLGESIIEVGEEAVGIPLTVTRTVAVGTGYALICALWWAYFVYGVTTFRRALEESNRHVDLQQSNQQVDLQRSLLVYGHLLFDLAIIAVAVGLGQVIMMPTEPLQIGETGLLFGGCALFLAAFSYTNWRIRREFTWRRIGPAALCLVLLPVATLLPALAALMVLIMVVAGVSALENLILHHRATSNPSGVTDRGPLMGA